MQVKKNTNKQTCMMQKYYEQINQKAVQDVPKI